MAAVFLSYSSQDRERVALLAESLRAEGFEVWWDREIPVAVTYEDYIRQQLDSAGAVVVVWSQASVASRYVRWEAQRAERRRGVLVPVLIEDADLPPEYFLVQSADLTRWIGDRSDREWRRLVAALVRLVGEPARAGVAEGERAPEARVVEEAAPVVAAAPEPEAPAAVPVVEAPLAEEPPVLAPEIPAEVSAVELEPVPEEAMPLADLLEVGETEAAPPVEEVSVPPAASAVAEEGSAPGEAEPAVVSEEVEEEVAAAAEVEIAESLRTWEPAAEEAPAPAEVEEEAAAAAGEPRSAVPWYRRWWVLAGAGGLLAAVVVLAVVMRPRGGGEEAATTLPVSTTEAVSTSGAPVAPTTTVASGTTAAATTSTTVPDVPDVPDMQWARVPSDLVLTLMPPSGWGVEFGSGRVAVGSDGSGGDEDAAAYVTSDGVTWERVPHDETVFGGDGDQVMRAVTAWPGGLVAVGQDGSSGVVWTSTDGYTWERVPDEAGVFGRAGEPREVWGVTAGGPGLVAVGIERADPVGGEADGAVWTSADGRAWMRVSDDAGVFSGPGNQEIYAVAVGGPGLVAVGYADAVAAATSDQGWDAAVWISDDGVSWERVAGGSAVLGGVGKQVMYGLLAGGPGLVAVGADDLSGSYWDADPLSGSYWDGAVWASTDGLTWERVADDGGLFGGDGHQILRGLAQVEGLGLVASGEDHADPSMKGIWVSPPLPGLEWARVAEGTEDFGSGFSESRAVAAGGSGLVAVGVVEASGPGDYYDAAVWTSVNGVAWYRVTGQQSALGGPGGQGMIDVVAGGPGYVAIGFDNPGDDPWSGDAAVWTSRDGTAWERVTDDAGAFGGLGNGQMRAVAVGGPGLVAVGWELAADGPNAAVWTSVDGLAWARVDDQESLRRGAMRAVVAGGPGLVAVGDSGVWTSADGLTWERVGGHEGVFDNSAMFTVVAGGPGLVAVGFNWPEGTGEWGDVAVWVSADGTTWERVPHDEALFSVPYDILEDCEVVSTGRGLVAAAWGVDHDAVAETAYGALVWYSTDGVTWSRVPEDAGIFGNPGDWSGVAGLALTDEGVVAVGQLQRSVAVWMSPPPD